MKGNVISKVELSSPDKRKARPILVRVSKVSSANERTMSSLPKLSKPSSAHTASIALQNKVTKQASKLIKVNLKLPTTL